MANKGIAYAVSGVLAVLVAAGGYGVMIKPKIESAQEIKSSIVVESAYRDTMVDLRSRAEAVKADFPKIAAEAAQFNAAFPSAADQAGLLTAINTAVSQGKVKINTLTPSPALALEEITREVQERLDAEALTSGVTTVADGDPRYTYMGVDVNVSGTQAQQRAFLRAIEDLDRKLYIQNVSSTVFEGNKGDLKLTLIAMITAPLVDPTVPLEESPTDDDAATPDGSNASPAPAGEGQ